MGNQSVGISMADPDNRQLIAEGAMRSSQNDSQNPMHLQNHDYNMNEHVYDTVSPLSWSVRHPHNCSPRSENNNREFKIPIHVMTCTPKRQVQVHVPIEGLFS